MKTATRGSLSARDIPIEKITIDKIEKLYSNTRTNGDCVVYKTPHHTGYSYTRISGTKHPIHRVIIAISTGRNYPGMVTDHLCKNKACIRVSHLEIVTQGVNISRGTAWHIMSQLPKTRREVCKRGHPYTKRYEYNGQTYPYCGECAKEREASHAKKD